MSFPNPWIGRNYIEDGNPVVPAPPAHFLAAVHDQDAQLVLLPSRQQPFTYVVARRRQLTKGLASMPVDAQTPPDTKMCVEYGVIPVCRMFHQGQGWDPAPLIAKLRARDLWAHGGPDVVADLMDAQDEREAAKTHAAIRSDLYERSGDGWRTYQARTGQRVLGRAETASGAAGSNAPLVVP